MERRIKKISRAIAGENPSGPVPFTIQGTGGASTCPATGFHTTDPQLMRQ